MKRYKQIDLLGSILLIIFFIVAGFVWQDYRFIIGYFVVGGWQLISMAVHQANGWFVQKGSWRRIYHWLVITVLVFCLLGFAIPPFLMIFWVLVFAAPLMAVAYTMICFEELQTITHRPLSILK